MDVLKINVVDDDDDDDDDEYYGNNCSQWAEMGVH